jgi:hypothetical protein
VAEASDNCDENVSERDVVGVDELKGVFGSSQISSKGSKYTSHDEPPRKDTRPISRG